MAWFSRKQRQGRKQDKGVRFAGRGLRGTEQGLEHQAPPEWESSWFFFPHLCSGLRQIRLLGLCPLHNCDSWGSKQCDTSLSRGRTPTSKLSTTRPPPPTHARKCHTLRIEFDFQRNAARPKHALSHMGTNRLGQLGLEGGHISPISPPSTFSLHSRGLVETVELSTGTGSGDMGIFFTV